MTDRRDELSPDTDDAERPMSDDQTNRDATPPGDDRQDQPAAPDRGSGQRISWRAKDTVAPHASDADNAPETITPAIPMLPEPPAPRPFRLPPPRQRALAQPRLSLTPATPILDTIGRDLTALARAGALRTVIGRDSLILEVARGLLRRDKPNPLLIGEPGVGKTAIVEGLAQRIVAQDVDERLAGLRIVEVPVSAIVAGTTLRGSLEARMRELLSELHDQRQIVIFLDEIHQVLGAGSAERSDLDVAEMLKPALARGEIRCIGATTPADIEPILRQDQALARRLLPLRVDEMSDAAATELVAALAPEYAAHHGVTIAPETIPAAVKLGVRYLPDRRLPDKALELLDDACTRIALPAIDRRADELTRPHVTPATIVEVIAARLGITVPPWDDALSGSASTTGQASTGTPIDLAERLGTRIIGQPAAIAAVDEAVRVATLGLRASDRPRAVLLFGGPTGVGKTALARALASELFGDDRVFLRLDMSEFREPHEAARLIGAPPGYVGYGDGGQLVRFLRHNPESVVLLDEIEKAHPQVLDLFLQVFDAGRITDSQGRETDARQAYFIMTTNIPMEVDLARLRARLRPEFLNRIDRVVPFRPLELPDLERIARQRLDEIMTDLRVRRIHLLANDAAITCLARPEDDGRAANGRTIARRLEREVVAPVAEIVALLGTPANGMPLVLNLTASANGCRVSPSGSVGGLSA